MMSDGNRFSLSTSNQKDVNCDHNNQTITAGKDSSARINNDANNTNSKEMPGLNKSQNDPYLLSNNPLIQHNSARETLILSSTPTNSRNTNEFGSYTSSGISSSVTQKSVNAPITGLAASFSTTACIPPNNANLQGNTLTATTNPSTDIMGGTSGYSTGGLNSQSATGGISGSAAGGMNSQYGTEVTSGYSTGGMNTQSATGGITGSAAGGMNSQYATGGISGYAASGVNTQSATGGISGSAASGLNTQSPTGRTSGYAASGVNTQSATGGISGSAVSGLNTQSISNTAYNSGVSYSGMNTQSGTNTGVTYGLPPIGFNTQPISSTGLTSGLPSSGMNTQSGAGTGVTYGLPPIGFNTQPISSTGLQSSGMNTQSGANTGVTSDLQSSGMNNQSSSNTGVTYGLPSSGMNTQFGADTGVTYCLPPIGFNTQPISSTGLTSGLQSSGINTQSGADTGVTYGLPPIGFNTQQISSTGLTSGLQPSGINTQSGADTGVTYGLPPIGFNTQPISSTGLTSGLPSSGVNTQSSSTTGVTYDLPSSGFNAQPISSTGLTSGLPSSGMNTQSGANTDVTYGLPSSGINTQSSSKTSVTYGLPSSGIDNTSVSDPNLTGGGISGDQTHKSNIDGVNESFSAKKREDNKSLTFSGSLLASREVPSSPAFVIPGAKRSPDAKKTLFACNRNERSLENSDTSRLTKVSLNDASQKARGSDKLGNDILSRTKSEIANIGPQQDSLPTQQNKDSISNTKSLPVSGMDVQCSNNNFTNVNLNQRVENTIIASSEGITSNYLIGPSKSAQKMNFESNNVSRRRVMVSEDDDFDDEDLSDDSPVDHPMQNSNVSNMMTGYNYPQTVHHPMQNSNVSNMMTGYNYPQTEDHLMQNSNVSNMMTSCNYPPTENQPMQNSNVSNITPSCIYPPSANTTNFMVPQASMIQEQPAVRSTSDAKTQEPICKKLKIRNYWDLKRHIKKWEVELETNEKLFLEVGNKLRKWSDKVVDMEGRMSSIEASLEGSNEMLDHVVSSLDALMMEQETLSEILEKYEKTLESVLYSAPKGSIQDERAKLYTYVIVLNENIEQTKALMAEVIADLNSVYNKKLSSDPSIDVAAKVIENHRLSIAWCDAQISSIKNGMELFRKRYRI